MPGYGAALASGLDAPTLAATVMPHPFRFQGNQRWRAKARAAESGLCIHVVAGDYWRTMKIDLTAGRLFSAGDSSDSQLVAVVSRSVADQLWPDGSAIGRRIRTSPAPDAP